MTDSKVAKFQLKFRDRNVSLSLSLSLSLFACKSCLCSRDSESSERNGDEGADGISEEEAHPSVFRAPGRALESRRSLAVNAKRQIPRLAARSSQSRTVEFRAKAAEKAFSPCVHRLANAKPFHLRDYGTSIFSARDPVPSCLRRRRAVRESGKGSRQKREGERKNQAR